MQIAKLIKSIYKNQEIILTSTKRDILSKYKGSVLGLFWSALNPLMMIFIYTFVFSEIFSAKWSNQNQTKIEFALILFAGLIVFNFFAECIIKAPILITSNPNYVKKIVYPLEILAIISTLSGLYNLLINILIWTFIYTAIVGLPHITILQIPIALIPLILLIVGLNWIISSIAVYMRDISQIIGPLINILMFLSPIFYPAEAMPEKYKSILYINPLTINIETIRDALYWGKNIDIKFYFINLIISSLVFIFGYMFFQKVRRGFADVI